MQTLRATMLTRTSAAAALALGALAGTACQSGAPVAAAPAGYGAPSAPAAASAWPGTGAGPAAGLVAAPAPAASPVAVNCGPGQQALIRPIQVGGQAVSQVDCVALAGAAAPAAYHGLATAAAHDPDLRVAEEPVVYRRPAPRVVRVEEAPRVVRRKAGRSWQKSAIVIGSSAGVGAAVGGAIDGKKGALIGAAIGGGGATIWDQATRRK
jgi:hypothetical protein